MILIFLREFAIVMTGFCHCGFSKTTTGNQGCEICTSDMMKAIKQSVASGKITPELSQFYQD